MVWSSATDETLLARKLRDIVAHIRTELDDTKTLLQTARTIVLAVRDEVQAARGGQPTLADRLSAIEARLTALEPTP